MMILSISIATILSVGLMIGVEFAVWAFINPVLRQLADQPRAQAVAMFARNLGTAMPFWYVSNFLLLIAEWLFLRRTPGALPTAVAVVLWALVIILTLVFLVPINNRLARPEAHVSAEHTHREHRRWDLMHRARVVTLIVAFALVLVGLHS